MTNLPVDDYCPSRFEFAEVLAAWGVAALSVVLVVVALPRVL